MAIMWFGQAQAEYCFSFFIRPYEVHALRFWRVSKALVEVLYTDAIPTMHRKSDTISKLLAMNHPGIL